MCLTLLQQRKVCPSVMNTFSPVPLTVAATHATNTLLAMPEYKAARRISVYLSMPTGEINTSNIVRDALEQGKKVFIPYTYNLDNPVDGQPKSIMDMVELSSMKDFESLEADKWGIPTPSKDSISSRANCFGTMGVTNVKSEHITEGLDLIVMPGMAFDHRFGRLGHGKGFYDFFLSRCHQAARMPFRGKNYWYSTVADGLANHAKVGLSLTEQLLPPSESVPMDQSDFRLDALVTGDGDLRRA
jgi:5-formyltetrahydrofolate cyclo-ligase